MCQNGSATPNHLCMCHRKQTSSSIFNTIKPQTVFFVDIKTLAKQPKHVCWHVFNWTFEVLPHNTQLTEWGNSQTCSTTTATYHHRPQLSAAALLRSVAHQLWKLYSWVNQYVCLFSLKWLIVHHPDKSSLTGRTVHGMTAQYACL